MRYILYSLIFLALAQPAFAANLSPIQQYLQNEAGYAPPELAPLPPQAATNPVNPPVTPPTTGSAAPGSSSAYNQENQLTVGFVAMNNI